MSGDGAMVPGVNAPGSFNGVEYGLESVEICILVESGSAFLTHIEMFRTNTAASPERILDDPTDRTATGCYVHQVGKSVGRGAGIALQLAGGGLVRINGATLTWTTDAFVTSTLSSAGGTEGSDG